MSFLNKPGLTGFFSMLAAVVGLGSLSALAMPPWGQWWVLIFGLGGLYALLCQATTKRRAFFLGWGFGFGYFLFGLMWIGNALLVEGNDYAWAWPLAVCGLPMVLSIFFGVATLASHMLFKPLSDWRGLIGFVACLSLSEWLRGHLFTGFPWNLFGYSWADHLDMLQILRLSDVYWLTGLSVFWFSVPAYIGLRFKAKSAIVIGIIAALSLIATYMYGGTVLRNSVTQFDTAAQIKVIQPNIAQSDKWKREKLFDNFLTMIDMSYSTPDTDEVETVFIIWPETAFSFWVLRSEAARDHIRTMLHSYSGEAILVTGLLDYDVETEEYSNALVSFNKDAEIITNYKKSHLVPFGEYIPFQNWIPLQTVTQFSGFTKGDAPIAQKAHSQYSFLPLICYEVIFPSMIDAVAGVNFIVNVTNDGWYGDSAGPYQHLAMAKYRAIESGLPVIRAANTGISAAFDGQGRHIKSIPILKNGIFSINAPLVKKTYSTPFIRQAFVFPIFLIILCCFLRFSLLRYKK